MSFVLFRVSPKGLLILQKTCNHGKKSQQFDIFC